MTSERDRTTSTPEVSVVMSVYGNVEDLPVTVDSVLIQTLRDFELIIVDDGNDADGKAVIRDLAARDPRIRVIENDGNIGLTRSLIKGCAAARGHFIARIDNSDIMVPRYRLEEQRKLLNGRPDVGLVAGNGEYVDFLNRERYRTNFEITSEDDAAQALSKSPCFHHPTVMFRKSLYDRVGGYDARYPTGQDNELWERMLKEAKAIVLKDTLAVMVMKKTSISVMKNRIQIFRKMRRIIREERPGKGVKGFVASVRRIALEIPKFFIPIRYRLQLRHKRWGYYLGSIDDAYLRSPEALYDFYKKNGYLRS